MAKMKLKTKGIIKKVALALAGVTAVTAIGFGIKAIVDYTKNDLKTISPSFEVGNLGADGKFVDDESTLYTKEAFACYGLQVKPDFDSTVNYQIFYYDILGNYISSTSVLSDGYSDDAPLNGAYARMVIEPRDDEDGKISWTERISYPKQLTVKVNKEQDINNRFIVFKGELMQAVNNKSDLVFVSGIKLQTDLSGWFEHNSFCATSTTFLSVNGGSTLTFDKGPLNLSGAVTTNIFEFSGLPSDETFIECTSEKTTLTLNKTTKYIIISVYTAEASGWKDSDLAKLPSLFTITKTK